MYHSLQLCRAVAAILVVLFHLGGAIGSEKYFNIPVLVRSLAFGNAGVAFFFVLSGFIITHVHSRELGQPASFFSFVRKRITRIYPTFAIVFFLVFVAGQIVPSTRASLPTDPWVLLKALSLLPQDVEQAGGTGAPVLIVAWSLHYELLFYALFGVAILSRAVAVVLLFLLAANAAVCLQGAGCRFPSSFFASHWLLLFGFGAIVSHLMRQIEVAWKPLRLAALGALAFGAIAAMEVGGLLPDEPFLHVAYGLAASLIVFGLVHAERAQEVGFRHPVIGAIGDASYAIYLLHYPLISLACKFAMAVGLHGGWGAAIMFPTTLLLCVVTSHVFHRQVELPVLNWLKYNLPARWQKANSKIGHAR